MVDSVLREVETGVSGVWESRGGGKEGRGSKDERSWRDETLPVEGSGAGSAASRSRGMRAIRPL